MKLSDMIMRLMFAGLSLLSSSTTRVQLAEAVRHDCPQNGCSGLDTCDTLDELVAYLMCKSPRRESQKYTPPSLELLAAWKDVVGSVLSGEGCSTSGLPNSLQRLHYRLEPFREDSGDYCVLASFELDVSGEHLAQPYGTVVINLGSKENSVVKPLSIDIPHGIHDYQTYRQGIAIFKGTHAKSFTLSGSHRKATTQPSCQGRRFLIADAAHNNVHTFQMNALAIKAYWDQRGQDFTAIQFHGMGTSQCPWDDVFMTYGSDVAPQAGGKLELLRNAFRDQLLLDHPKASGQRVSMMGDSNCTLTGALNTQGRFFNGVANEDVCDTPPTGYTGQFIHIEQNIFIRTSAEYDRKWIHAINAVDWKEAAEPVSLPTSLALTCLDSSKSEDRVATKRNSSDSEDKEVKRSAVHRTADQEWTHTKIATAALNTGSHTWKASDALSMDEAVFLLVLSKEITTPDALDLNNAFSSVVGTPGHIAGDASTAGHPLETEWEFEEFRDDVYGVLGNGSKA